MKSEDIVVTTCAEGQLPKGLVTVLVSTYITINGVGSNCTILGPGGLKFEMRHDISHKDQYTWRMKNLRKATPGEQLLYHINGSYVIGDQDD